MSVILGIEVKAGPKWLGKDGRKRVREITRDGLKAAAWFWHDEVLPRHFTPSNRSRYQHDPRTQVYTQFIKKRAGTGQGRYVDNLLDGKSRRYLLAFASVTGTSRSVTLRMKPPGYFTRPFIGTFTHPKTGQTKRITQQPDKPAEIRTVDARDARDVRDFGAQIIGRMLRNAETLHRQGFRS